MVFALCVSAALPGGAISGADAVPRGPGGAGGAAATRARRFRWAAGRARSLRRALRRCGAARCASPARAWGVFSGLRVVWGELSVAPGRTARGGGGFRSGGLPQGFLCGFFVQSPGRSRMAVRPVRGEAEACVSSRRPRLGSAWLGALWQFGVRSLGKAQTRHPTCASLRIQSHLSDPRIMQSMLLLFACSAVALLPAPARQHRARGVVRMGWGDPPVCEPRPRSDFCARCTPSTRLAVGTPIARAGLVRGDHQIEHRGLRRPPRD